MSLSQSYDEEEFIQEVQTAHKKYRDYYKHEVNKRNEQMAWNEAQANESMAATIEQDKKYVARPYRAQERSLKNSVENIRGDVMRARSARQKDMDDTIQACIYNIKRRNLDNKIKNGLDDGLPVIKTINKESGHKQSVNQQFWHSIKSLVFVISCAAIAVYTLIHFA
tara:strand:+ start:8309 stop:8809 length:501 start_codon:yes stop_codon:yes gene_type:complete